LGPNKFIGFTSFDPENDYLFPVYKQTQLRKTLEYIYYNFERFYFRYIPDIFDNRIRFLLNNSSLTRQAILQLPEMNEHFLTEKEVNQYNYNKYFNNL
jgi:hypothetical protein